MDIKVTGRKMQVSDSLRAYATEKIGNACKVFDINPMTCDIVLRVEKNPSNPKSDVAEVTIRTKGHVVRVSEADTDMHAAIDAAADKVQRQLRKYKTRIVDRRARAEKTIDIVAEAEPLPPVVFDDDEAIVRTKEIEYLTLTEEEALIQTDLLGHDFFVYNDADTGLTNVIYRREAGGYGIIKPKLETQD